MERSEGIGLAIAAVGHVALLALLSARLFVAEEERPVSPTITVQLSDEIGLESTTPTPAVETATSQAPELGEIEPDMNVSEPVARPDTPLPTAAPEPRPSPAPTPKPAREKPKPAEKKPAPETRRPPEKKPSAPPAAKAQAKPAPAPESKPRGSRLGKDFLKGTSNTESDSTDTNSTAKAGAAEVAALEREIGRKLKPHWTAPTGGDAELLITRVSWSMRSDGSLTGGMSCRQVGKVTPSNSPQVDLHCERAKAAIKRAAPFNSLPDKFYDAWKDVVFNFDRKL